MKKIVNIIMPILIILVWLIPVSNQYNTLNNEMMVRCYILSLIVLVFVFLYEGRIDKHQIAIAVLILVLLVSFTVITVFSNKDNPTVSYGYLLNYLPFCVLINIKGIKLHKAKILDGLFIIVCSILTLVGILTVLDNSFIEQLLKTNYVIHYPHIYTAMWAKHKTVTFFGTHSIACYIYYILWWLLDYRRHIKKGVINYILMAGILFNILMCLSVSAVLCIGIIFGFYYISWAKKANRNAVIKSLFLLGVAAIFIFVNIDTIITIMSSSKNGIWGRFGTSGNLNYTLAYAIKNVVPIGICDIRGLWLTDGGYFIHFIRGGVLLLLLFYYGLYRFMKMNITDRSRCNLLFISLLLFETGYQFTMCMRFFMIMLYAILYFTYLFEERKKMEDIAIMENIR